MRQLVRLFSTLIFTVSVLALVPAAHASTIWQDSFTDSNSTAIETHNGTVYDDQGGTTSTIQSNKLNVRGDVKVQTSDQTDGCISVDATTALNNTVVLSIRSGASYNYDADWTNTSVTLYKGATNLGTASYSSLSGTHNFKLCAKGDKLAVYLDGVVKVWATDSTYSSSGAYYIYAQNETVDNLAITSFPTSGGTLLLDHFAGTTNDTIETYNSTLYDDQSGNTTTIQTGKLNLRGDVKVMTYDQTDGCIAVDATFPLNNEVTLSVRSGAAYNYDANFYNSDVYINEGVTHLAHPGYPSLSSGTHNLRFCAKGANLTAYVDGHLVASGTSTTYASAGAYYMYAGNETVDELKITNL